MFHKRKRKKNIFRVSDNNISTENSFTFFYKDETGKNN